MKEIWFVVTLAEATEIVASMAHVRATPDHQAEHDRITKKIAAQLGLQAFTSEIMAAAQSVTSNAKADEFPDVIGGDE